MPRRRKVDALSVLGAAAVAMVVAGCAEVGTAPTPAGTPVENEKLVAQRAEARWAALIKGDVDSAYTFMSPGSKATMSLALYKSKIKPGIWKKAKAEKVTCDGEVCSVLMQITIDTQKMKGIETTLTENWIIENGAAWYVYR